MFVDSTESATACNNVVGGFRRLRRRGARRLGRDAPVQSAAGAAPLAAAELRIHAGAGRLRL